MQRASIQRKAKEVDQLAEKFEQAKTIVVFDYQGLTVTQFTDLRGQLRESQVEVKVYKNNISRRASLKAGYEALVDELVGAKAIAISYEDPVAPAKIIYDFARKNKVVKLASGVIEGKVASNEDIMVLATLPSEEVLLTQLAVGLLTPIRELAIGLNMIAEEQEQE